MKRLIKIENQEYIDADTGKILFSIPMRRFYEWDRHNSEYVCVRQYPLENEATVNPDFKDEK